LLIRETNESIATRHAGDGVGHDLSRLAWWETSLEEGNQDIFVDLWAKIANEDRVLWAAVITKKTVSLCYKDAIAYRRVVEYKPGFWPSVGESTAGSPVELERAGGVGNHRAVEGKCLRCGSWGGEIDETVTSITIKMSVVIRK
jgi:hypothetical protein